MQPHRHVRYLGYQHDLEITSGKMHFVLLYKSMGRSHLEFSNSVWSPHKIGLTEKIEKVQKRATKMVPSCKGLSYMSVGGHFIAEMDVTQIQLLSRFS